MHVNPKTIALNGQPHRIVNSDTAQHSSDQVCTFFHQAQPTNF